MSGCTAEQLSAHSGKGFLETLETPDTAKKQQQPFWTHDNRMHHILLEPGLLLFGPAMTQEFIFHTVQSLVPLQADNRVPCGLGVLSSPIGLTLLPNQRPRREMSSRLGRMNTT